MRDSMRARRAEGVAEAASKRSEGKMASTMSGMSPERLMTSIAEYGSTRGSCCVRSGAKGRRTGSVWLNST